MTGTAYLSQAIDKKNIVPFFWPFLLRLTLRLANNAIMNEKDFWKPNMGLKKAEFYAI